MTALRRPLAAVPLAAVAALVALAPAPAHAGETPVRLRDAHGHPLAGASVTLDSDPSGAYTAMAFPRRLRGAGPTAMPLARVKTDARGRGHLPLRPTGDMLAVVRRHGRVIGALYPSPGARGPVTLTLPRAITVRGRVVDEAGHPLKGIEVTVGTTAFDLPAVRTGAQGRFAVKVHAPTGLPWLAHVAGPTEALHIFALMPHQSHRLVAAPGRSVRGTVRAHGHPVAGAHVEDAGRFHRAATTGAHGHFVITGLAILPTGVHGTLEARHGDALGSAPIPGGPHPHPVVIDLIDPARLAVHVLDARGRPVAGARVEVAGHRARSGAAGVARFPSVPRKILRVSVRAAGHGKGAADLVVHRDQASVAVTVRLPAGPALPGGHR